MRSTAWIGLIAVLALCGPGPAWAQPDDSEDDADTAPAAPTPPPSVLKPLAAGSAKASSPSAGTVTLQVLEVGFKRVLVDPTETQVNVGRVGQQVPVLLSLTNRGSAPFTGEIRVQSVDADGDLMTTRLPIALAPQQKDRRVTAPVLLSDASMSRSQTLGVTLLDADGQLVQLDESFRLSQVRLLEEGERLVLLLGYGATEWLSQGQRIENLNAVSEAIRSDLAVPGVMLRERQPRAPERPALEVATIQPADLPIMADQLESVDHLVWDQPVPDQLSTSQTRALLDWVRQGGSLTMCLGAGHALLKDTPWQEALAAPIVGHVQQPVWSSDKPLVVCQADLSKLAVGADVAFLTPDPAGATRIPLVLRRPIGAGLAMTLLASWADVVRGPTGSTLAQDRSRRLAALALGIPLAQDPKALAEWVKAQQSGLATLTEPLSLPNQARTGIGFGTESAAMLVVGTVLMALYVLGATLGVNYYLRLKGLTQHSWSGFAIVATVCSLLSLGAVIAYKGTGVRVQQISLVDLRAGSGEGQAWSAFGLISGVDRAVDLAVMPVGLDRLNQRPGREALTGASHRLLPVLSDDTASHFAPHTYQLLMPGAVGDGTTRDISLADVRLRSTLKQFTATYPIWLEGQVSGTLTRPGDEPSALSGRVVNTLGVPLKDPVLAWGRVSGTGLVQAPDLFLLSLGKELLPGQHVDVGLERSKLGSTGGLLDRARELAPRSSLLARELGPEAALRLISLASAIESRPGTPTMGATLAISGGNTRGLDRVMRVTDRQALLIATTPGLVPGRLSVGQEGSMWPQEPVGNQCLIRVLLPVALTGDAGP